MLSAVYPAFPRTRGNSVNTLLSPWSPEFCRPSPRLAALLLTRNPRTHPPSLVDACRKNLATTTSTTACTRHAGCSSRMDYDRLRMSQYTGSMHNPSLICTCLRFTGAHGLGESNTHVAETWRVLIYFSQASRLASICHAWEHDFTLTPDIQAFSCSTCCSSCPYSRHGQTGLTLPWSMAGLPSSAYMRFSLISRMMCQGFSCYQHGKTTLIIQKARHWGCSTRHKILVVCKSLYTIVLGTCSPQYSAVRVVSLPMATTRFHHLFICRVCRLRRFSPTVWAVGRLCKARPTFFLFND